MKALIVHAHPEPQSFNAAMTNIAASTLKKAGHEVEISDLYAKGFDPVSSRKNFSTAADPDFLKLQNEERHASQTKGFSKLLETEISALEAADLLILQFPLWWFGMPAIMKGWVDRCFAAGRIYGNTPPYQSGRFRGRRALLSVTTGAPAEVYQPKGMHGDILGILRPIHRGILNFVGYDVLAPNVVFGTARAGPAYRERMLEAWGNRLIAIEEEVAIDTGAY